MDLYMGYINTMKEECSIFITKHDTLKLFFQSMINIILLLGILRKEKAKNHVHHNNFLFTIMKNLVLSCKLVISSNRILI